MAFKLGEFLWFIKANTTDFDKGVATTDKKTKSLGTSVGKIASGMTVAFAAVAVAGIGKITKELISSASEAQEVGDKFDVVFANVADEAQAAGDRIKEEFRLSDRETEQFLSQVGDITTGLGATSAEALGAAEEITALGLDLASFSNGNAEQAVSALTSLFTGEREAAKAFGLVINETSLADYAEETNRLYSAMTPLEKGFLSLELATEQSQLALGNAKDTAGSYANTLKAANSSVINLKDALGTGLLPTATQAVSVFNEMTMALTGMVTEASTLKSVLSDLGDGAISEERTLEELVTTLEKLEKLNRSQSGQGRFTEEIISLKALIENYDVQDSWLNKELGLKESLLLAEQNLAKAEAERSAAQAAADAQRDGDLRTYLELVASEYATTQQGKIDAIEAEIESWELLAETAVKTAPQVQAILEEKRAQLEALTDVSEEATEAQIEQGESLRTMYEEAAAGAIDYQAIIEAQRVAEQAVLDQRVAAYANLFGSISTLIGSFGDESMAQFVAMKAFAHAEAGINSFLAFTQVLADPSLIGRPFTRALAAGAVLTAGLAQQVSIANTPTPSFETGGIVQGSSYSGDQTAANVNAGEMILNAKQQAELFSQANGSGSSGGNLYLSISLDGKPIAESTVNNYINKGRILVDLKRGTK